MDPGRGIPATCPPGQEYRRLDIRRTRAMGGAAESRARGRLLTPAEVERLELIVDRFERGLKTVTEHAFHLKAQTEDATELIAELQELKRGFAFLLNRTSRAITEKAIWDQLDKFEKEEERRKHFRNNSPGGVPRKVLDGS